MKRKKIFYSELAYLAGILILALATAFMERADFGVSMVVAPAYLLHLKLAETFPVFSFGMAEYCLQAVVLLLLSAVVRRLKVKYLFSFATAVFYGLVLDLMIGLVALLPAPTLLGRAALYVLGMLLCAMAVSLLFHTYVTPEAYELFVKEVASRFHKRISATKTVYDCCSCLIAVIMSFVFFGFGHFEGVKLGTILCALINGTLIGMFSRLLERRFDFRDAWPMRSLFE